MRPFEYTEVKKKFPICYGGDRILCLHIFKVQIVLKDEDDIDPNDQNSILEHLDKVVTIQFSRISCGYLFFSCLFFDYASKNIYKIVRSEI